MRMIKEEVYEGTWEKRKHIMMGNYKNCAGSLLLTSALFPPSHLKQHSSEVSIRTPPKERIVQRTISQTRGNNIEHWRQIMLNKLFFIFPKCKINCWTIFSVAMSDNVVCEEEPNFCVRLFVSFCLLIICKWIFFVKVSRTKTLVKWNKKKCRLHVLEFKLNRTKISL